ncbi:hypothetical protein SAY86_020426 [Trapa natans]|uniref:DUF4378 domain-containing protein n=1 Tax=Trapa natans TaxID=22666 RepID=A0AAN7R469_TRANT|nr:hypothetical protein SAY86_020426 [Trapa natans]
MEKKRLPLKSPQLPQDYGSGCKSWGFMRFFGLFNGHSRHDSVSVPPKLLPASGRKYRGEKENHSIDSEFASMYNPRRGKNEHNPSTSPGYSSKRNGKRYQIREYPDHRRDDEKGCQKIHRLDLTGRVSDSTLAGVFWRYSCRNIGCVNDRFTGAKHRSSNVAGMVEAVVSRKPINRTDDKSKELLETLDILNSNKELLLRMLENPDSLLAKHIEDLLGSKGNRPRAKLYLRQHEGNSLSCVAQRENRQFLSLWRVKSEESSAFKRNHHAKELKGAVALKPQSDFSVRNKLQGVQHSYFHLRHLRRRKLRWMQQKMNVETRAASVGKANCKRTVGLSIHRDCENKKEQLSMFSNGRDRIKELSEEKIQMNSSMPLFSIPSDRVESDSELGILEEAERCLSCPLKQNVESLSQCDESHDQSDCLGTSGNIVPSTETREAKTALAHMSSEETQCLQEEPSSSRGGEIQERNDPLICTDIEDGVDESDHDQTAGMKWHLDSRTIMDESSHDLRSTGDYIKAVLNAAHLDWDKLLVDKIIEPSLLDEAKIPFKVSDTDQQLMFDYINEVLGEVLHCPGVMFRSCVPERNATRAVMKRAHRDRDLLLQKGTPTLEQLISKDMIYFSEWIDIPRNTEEIVTELVDDILDDALVEL